jgi:NAD(P)-dependent dehydrogenase (short-subunit alcohol dehydrogenase family)
MVPEYKAAMPGALVTGTRRIGGAIARALASAGCDVALAYRASREAAEAAAADVRAAGRQGVALQADLEDPAACRSLVDAAAGALGGLSVVVLAASRFDRIAFDALDAGAWDRGLAVDLDASFHCAQAAVPHLRRAGGGHVVLFSDWVAASGRPRYRGYLPYYVAKRGVAALGEALALELARDGIRVHVVAPGPIVPAEGTTETEAAAVLAATPLGRWGGEDEVARRVVGLVSSTFVTGETVRVDGGRHLR